MKKFKRYIIIFSLFFLTCFLFLSLRLASLDLNAGLSNVDEVHITKYSFVKIIPKNHPSFRVQEGARWMARLSLSYVFNELFPFELSSLSSNVKKLAAETYKGSKKSAFFSYLNWRIKHVYVFLVSLLELHFVLPVQDLISKMRTTFYMRE